LLGFWLRDQQGLSMSVVYYGAKPQDFERSEQVVIVGKVVPGPSKQENKSIFKADQILTKCPSKYTEDKVPTASTNP
ncbi:MAG: cytochrome c maturation protein CcmE, partial [Bacteroidota bacterium]